MSFCANDQFHIRFERLFRPYGLTTLPIQHPPHPARRRAAAAGALEIAARTITVVPGITGLIDRLQEAGFVARQRCAKDRRVVYAALTAKGEETLAALD